MFWLAISMSRVSHYSLTQFFVCVFFWGWGGDRLTAHEFSGVNKEKRDKYVPKCAVQMVQICTKWVSYDQNICFYFGNSTVTLG